MSRTFVSLALFFALLMYAVVFFTNIPGAYCSSPLDEIFGNFTFVTTPVQAVEIGDGEIPLGNAHTFTYNLEKGRRYHVYLSGAWANPKTHKTDYDIYVYRISGTSVNFYSSHTEAAGLPEQVSNDGVGRYFIPEETGLYYFVVKNDGIESSAEESATLMVIENIDSDHWMKRYMRGKQSGQAMLESNWAYEFITSAERLRIFIDVPKNLDMYEARLYVMGNPEAGKGELVECIPIAWEPGLRGQVSGVYGGFNFDPQGFRNQDAMASCEHSGQDMVIDYKAPVKGSLLYHLVLIAEYGEGTLNFVVQTDFTPPELLHEDPPEKVAAGEPTRLEVTVKDDTEATVSLSYSLNGERWRSVNVMSKDGSVFYGSIPGVVASTIVDYVLEASDFWGNKNSVNGSYLAVGKSSLDIWLNATDIRGGQFVSIVGSLYIGGRSVDLYYIHENDVCNYTLTTDTFGRFTHVFKPMYPGVWQFFSKYMGDEDYLPSESDRINFTVNSLPTQLTCKVSRGRVELGNSVKISGGLSLEEAGVGVEIVLKAKDSIMNLHCITVDDGGFSMSFKPESKGIWRIQAKVEGDGLVYEGTESEFIDLKVVDPSLTTRLLRLPSTIYANAGSFVKPPYLYGLIGILCVAGGGAAFYIRRRE
jgi:hypothetical protein